MLAEEDVNVPMDMLDLNVKKVSNLENVFIVAMGAEKKLKR